MTILGETELAPSVDGITEELLGVSKYVIETCGILQSSGDNGALACRSEGSPSLLLMARIDRAKMGTFLDAVVIESTFVVDYPDIQASLFVTNNPSFEPIPSDDPIANLILESFTERYWKKKPILTKLWIPQL